MSETNKATVRKVNASFENNDLEGFLSVCKEDIVWKIIGERTVSGAEAIREWMNSMGEIKPPKISINDLISEGDSVAAYGDMTMSDKDDKSVPYAYCDIYRFEDDRIIELTSYIVKTETK